MLRVSQRHQLLRVTNSPPGLHYTPVTLLPHLQWFRRLRRAALHRWPRYDVQRAFGACLPALGVQSVADAGFSQPLRTEHGPTVGHPSLAEPGVRYDVSGQLQQL